MSNLERYKSLNRKPLNQKEISTHIPTPNEVDYNRGFIKRCFIQKTNDKGSPIFEVKVNKLGVYSKNPLYTTVTIKWRIKGPLETQYNNKGNIIDKAVTESNRIAIKLVAHKIPNLKLYLPNLLQFYKN